MTTIVNGLNNQKGIQFYNNEIGVGQESSGRARFLRHTNGKIYIVYAVNELIASFTDPSTAITYTNLTSSRNLYFSYSNDGGNTWQPRVQLTTPAVVNDAITWDDFPVIIQLNTSSTTSDIGVMFNRSNSTNGIYRFTCNIYGGITSPIDYITSTFYPIYPMDLIPYPGGFAAILLIDGVPQITINPTGFTTNDWYGSADAYEGNGFQSFNQVGGGGIFSPGSAPNSLRCIQLVNGDYACVYTQVTVRNGLSEVVGNGSSPLATNRNDVYIIFSQDTLQHWSAPQNVTSYTGAPSFTLGSGIPSAIEASIDQLTDNTISIVYTEAIAPQCLSNATTPTLQFANYGNNDPRFGNIAISESGAGYILSGNIGNGSENQNGLYVYRLSDGLVRNFNTGSAINPIWSNYIYGISVSTGGTYVAVQTDTSIEIFNTSGGSDPDSWTLTSLRSTTTPAMHGNPANIQFIDSEHLFIGWQNSGIGRVFGSILNCASISSGLIDCQSDSNNAIQGMPIRGYLQVITPTTGDQVLIFPANLPSGTSSAWFHIDLTQEIIGNSNNNYSGAILAPMAPQIGVYDTVNNKHIMASGLVVVDNGGSFSAATLSASSGQWPTYVSQMVSFPGAGCLMSGQANLIIPSDLQPCYYYYSYTKQTLSGIVLYNTDAPYNLQISTTGFATPFIDPSGNYLLYTNRADLFAISLLQNARLRVGNFPYNATTPALTLTGGSFYDGVNTAKVSSQECYSIMYPTHVRNISNNIIVYGSEFSPYNGSRPISPFIGVIEANAELLSTQAHISTKSTYGNQAKAHMSVTQTRTLQIKAGLVRGRAFYAKANILPRQANTVSALAVISGNQSTAIEGMFLVNSSSISSVRSAFYVNGIMTGQSFTCMALIQQANLVRMTGHFSVRRTGLGLISSNPSPIVAGNIKTMGVAAYIN